jgi:regulator of replication initiation timing
LFQTIILLSGLLLALTRAHLSKMSSTTPIRTRTRFQTTIPNAPQKSKRARITDTEPVVKEEDEVSQLMNKFASLQKKSKTEIDSLRVENATLRLENDALRKELSTLRSRMYRLLERIDEETDDEDEIDLEEDSESDTEEYFL